MTGTGSAGHDASIRSSVRFRLALAALVAVGALGGAAPFALRAPEAPSLAAALAGRPLALEARPDGFLARGGGYDALLEPTGQLVALHGPVQIERNRFVRPPRQAGFTVRFLGAGRATAEATEPLAPVEYVERAGTRRAATFARVSYRAVYPGIDLAYRGVGSRLRGDWLVAPGANPERIRVELDGVDAIGRRAGGALDIAVRGLHALLTRPVAYQVQDGERRAVRASWRVRGRTLSFALGAYDHTRPLVIDPTLQGTVTVGGDDVDTILDVDADSAGNLVGVGATFNAQFPRVGNGTWRPGGAFDGVIVTISPSLQVLSTTIFGGARDDLFQRVVAESPGEWIVGGATTSADLPMPHAVNAAFVGGTCGDDRCPDGMLLAFGNGGIRFGTYLGGTGLDEITALALDRSARGGKGLLAFGGITNSPSLLAPGALATALDGFVGTIEYDAIEDLHTGSSFRRQSFGSRGLDGIYGVAVRGDNVYAVGGGYTGSVLTRTGYTSFENAFVLSSRDAGATWQERVFARPDAYSELDSVAVDADGTLFAGFIGFFPGGDYGACTFGVCQPTGVVELDGGTLAPRGVATVVPPGRGRYALQDVDALRDRTGAITGLGAAVDSYATLAPGDPTGLVLIVEKGPRVSSQVALPPGTLLWGAAFSGSSLFVAGAAPEGAFPNVHGEADAFVSKLVDVGLGAPCNCASIAATAAPVKPKPNIVEFTVGWAMTCTGGSGTCRGALKVRAPRGVRLVWPTREIGCGPGPCGSGTIKGAFRVRARVSAPPGTRYTFRLDKWCLVGGARKALPAQRITVVVH